ncbi:MAG: peptidylprolyl isomerase [Candidatus Moraniibacteriota bacterium]|nr:MAG: peptidylprolyl isomerase [Candidatus Moranbacteria bacterium]
MTISTSAQKQRPKRRTFVSVFSVLFGSLLFVALLFVVTFGIVVWFPESAMSAVLRRIFPFPVAIVDGEPLSFRELVRNRESLRRFYQSQSDDLAKKGFRVDFDTPEGKNRLLIREKDILGKLIEDRILLSLASERHIAFSEGEVKVRFNPLLTKREEVVIVLNRNSKGSMDGIFRIFESRVVRPSLFRDAMNQWFEKERDSSKAKETIEEAARKLKTGESLERVAREFSDGDSAKNGGDLGWVQTSALVPELVAALEKQKRDEIGPVIESRLGFHIASVLGRKNESGSELIRVRQVFVRKPAFPEWLAKEKEKRNVWILSRRYTWDPQQGGVVFREESFRDFEKRSLEKSEGDPSLIF